VEVSHIATSALRRSLTQTNQRRHMVSRDNENEDEDGGRAQLVEHKLRIQP